MSATANDIVHRAARHFSWPTKLLWDGMHCLRLTGAQRLKDFIVKMMALLGPAAMSAGTAAIYTRLNVLRVDLDEGMSSSDASRRGGGAI